MRVGLVLSPGFQAICFGAIAAFDVANKQAGEKLYDVHVLSEQGGPLESSSGVRVYTEPLDETVYDTLIVAAGLEIPISSPGLIRPPPPRGPRGAPGGVDLPGNLHPGRCRTFEWAARNHLLALCARAAGPLPDCRVDMDKILVADGQIWTSAGMTAGIDLIVGMIERDQGPELARSVAKGMVIYHRRSGGQSQHSTLIDLSTSETGSR